MKRSYGKYIFALQLPCKYNVWIGTRDGPVLGKVTYNLLKQLFSLHLPPKPDMRSKEGCQDYTNSLFVFLNACRLAHISAPSIKYSLETNAECLTRLSSQAKNGILTSF